MSFILVMRAECPLSVAREAPVETSHCKGGHKVVGNPISHSLLAPSPPTTRMALSSDALNAALPSSEMATCKTCCRNFERVCHVIACRRLTPT